jgi:hypothetical protein
MELLEPDWKQIRPTAIEVHEMCEQIQLSHANLPEYPFETFLQRLRKSHDQGGAYLAAFDVGPNSVFDWFASRNRLEDEELLDQLLSHPSIRQAFPALLIPTSRKIKSGLTMSNQFLFDGALAQALYRGGAYHKAQGDGREEKTFSLEVCDAMFGLRFGEVSYYVTYDAWTPWFGGIAWDLTAVLFDRRVRKIWVTAITDTD